MDKLNPTTREKLLLISIASFTTTPTPNYITTPNDNSKRIVIGDLVKAQIKRLTTTSIKHIHNNT